MNFKEQLEKLKQETNVKTSVPQVSYKDYFWANYDNMNEVLRIIRLSNRELSKEESREVAYKKIAEMAFEDGIKTSHGNVMTVKQVGFLLAETYRARNGISNQSHQKAAKTEEKLLPKEEVAKLTKESIGWDRDTFETKASRYFHEHPKFWPFDKDLQLVLQWLKDDCPNIADKDSPEREKGESGWTYGEFYDEYLNARELRKNS